VGSGPVSSDFRVFAPREGVPPTVRTEARVRYDERALYFLVRAFDPHPDSIVRRLSRRDTFDATADVVLIFLDPLHDGRTGYEFAVTASGVKWDAALADDGNEDFSWDGVWDGATRIDSLGWVAEFAIPLRELRFSEHRAPEFGLFVGRWVGRSGERVSVPQYSRAKAGSLRRWESSAAFAIWRLQGRSRRRLTRWRGRAISRELRRRRRRWRLDPTSARTSNGCHDRTSALRERSTRTSVRSKRTPRS